MTISMYRSTKILILKMFSFPREIFMRLGKTVRQIAIKLDVHLQDSLTENIILRYVKIPTGKKITEAL